MEARLDLVLSWMERLSGELKELKSENAILRKEILGIGASGESSGQKGMGLMEKTTLRELVEEIQLDVKALNAKVERNVHDQECSGNGNKCSGEKRGEQELPSGDNRVENTKEPIEYFPVVEIKFKTIAEQRDWMKKSFAESVKQRSVSEGASFGERPLQALQALQSIPNSIVPTRIPITSCTLKLCNYLSSALTDPIFNVLHGSKRSGPSKVDPNVSEVFIFQDENYRRCQFLCSFGISSSLRLTIFSFTDFDRRIVFGMAFTPQDVPIDYLKIHPKLSSAKIEPDIWMTNTLEAVGTEGVIYGGKLLARGYMTPGRFSMLQIDIIEINDAVDAKMKPLQNGESISATLTSRNLFRGSSLNKVACIIEIGNCLNCTLRNPTGFFCNSSRNNFLPSEILPFYRESFIISDDENVEAMFTYEIESTDLCLVVALRVEAENNSFAVAFDQVPVHGNIYNFKALMHPTPWETQLYKKYANAKDGEQVIEIRNIRAIVKMTEDVESLLSIRVFAV